MIFNDQHSKLVPIVIPKLLKSSDTTKAIKNIPHVHTGLYITAKLIYLVSNYSICLTNLRFLQQVFFNFFNYIFDIRGTQKWMIVIGLTQIGTP